METNIITKLEKIIKKKGISEEEVIAGIKKLLAEYGLKNDRINETKSLSELFPAYCIGLQEVSSQELFIKTGFNHFDLEYGGLYPGELIIVGSRPSVGKTQLLINLALHISRTHPVLFVSFDLSALMLTARMTATLSGVPVNRILHNKLAENELKKVEWVRNELKQYNILINDSSNLTSEIFEEFCLKYIKEGNVKVILVDTLQLFESTKFKQKNMQRININHILKKIAKDNNVCIIVSSQLSRAVELRGGDHRPRLSDLRNSGTLEEDADKVLFLHSLEYYGFLEDENGCSTKGITELIITKNRNGRLGTIILKHDNDFTTFNDYMPFILTPDFPRKSVDELIFFEVSMNDYDIPF